MSSLTTLALVTLAITHGESWATPDLTPPKPHFDIVAGILASVGITPDPIVTGAVYGRVTRRHFAVELGLLGGRDSTTAVDATVTFAWFAARPAACLVKVRRIELGGCGAVEVGLVRATGGQIVNGRALDRLWLATGAYGYLRMSASRAFAQLQLGASVPIVRDTYRFNPGIVIHETAAVTGWLGVGVGLRFP